MTNSIDPDESTIIVDTVRAEVKTDFAAWLKKRAYAPATYDQSLSDFGTLLKKVGEPTPLRRTLRFVVRRLAAYGEDTGDAWAQNLARRCEERFERERPPRLGGRAPRMRESKSFGDDSWETLVPLIRATPGLPARVLEVMSETGLRINDVLQIKPHSIQRAVTNKTTLIVLQKGLISRPIDLRAAPDAWRHLLDEAKTKNATTTIAQLISPGAAHTTHGSSAPYQRVRAELRQICDAAGITERVFTHRFRHTFATRLADETGDIHLVRDALGHTNLSTTERYAGITKPEKIAAASRRIAVKVK